MITTGKEIKRFFEVHPELVGTRYMEEWINSLSDSEEIDTAKEFVFNGRIFKIDDIHLYEDEDMADIVPMTELLKEFKQRSEDVNLIRSQLTGEALTKFEEIYSLNVYD